jgi:hypothetical protein
MLANQRAAAAAGLKHGAAGYLNTDWGDYGHLQYLPSSFAGLAAGACMSWCLESNRELSLPEILDAQVFEDSAGIMGQAVCDLGNVYQAAGKQIINRSALFGILVPSSARRDPMEGLGRDNLLTARAAIDAAVRNIHQSKMRCKDPALVGSELENAAEMLRLACALGQWKRESSSENADNLNRRRDQIASNHRKYWLARNRPGGLADSLARLHPPIVSRK